MPSFDTLPAQRRYFYRLWAQAGFDPKKRNDCLSEAGYKDSVVKNYGAKIAKSVNFLIQREMMRQGITPRLLVEHHKQNLSAMHPLHAKMPDTAQRNVALKMAYELFDAFPAKKLEIEKRELVVNISLDTLRDVEEATGEKIVERISQGSVIDVDPEEIGDEEIEEDGDESNPL
jgi:SAM-dependent MidA family methyltransferase